MILRSSGGEGMVQQRKLYAPSPTSPTHACGRIHLLLFTEKPLGALTLTMRAREPEEACMQSMSMMMSMNSHTCVHGMTRTGLNTGMRRTRGSPVLSRAQ